MQRPLSVVWYGRSEVGAGARIIVVMVQRDVFGGVRWLYEWI